MKPPGNVHGMSLDQVRTEISDVDAAIIRLIAKRQELADQVAEIKQREGFSIHDEKRVAEVLETVSRDAEKSGIDPAAVQKIFGILIAMSEERQRGRS